MKIGWIAALVAVIASVHTADAQIDPRLPEGPNRELVARNCGSCHDLGTLFSTVGRTREGWRRTLEDMTRFGLVVTPQERTLILNYLSTYLAP
jgi:hypothetical protein